MAAPIVATVLIADVALGTVSRMVPQMNVFVIGMPLKIIIGLMIVALTIPMFIETMKSIFELMGASVSNYLKELYPDDLQNKPPVVRAGAGVKTGPKRQPRRKGARLEKGPVFQSRK